MQNAAQWALIVYGAFLILGGVLGYVLPKKPSKISLIMGVASGVLTLAAWLVSRTAPFEGYVLGLVVTAGVGAIMFLRLQKTKKFMPSGMLVLLSLIVVVLLALALAFSEKVGTGAGGG